MRAARRRHHDDPRDHAAAGCARGRAARALAAIGALAGITMLVAACGGDVSNPGVASLKSTKTSTSGAGAPSSASTRQSGLLYARCMRAHGVSSFPDPIPGRGFDVPMDLKRDPDYRSAVQACQDDLPSGGPAGKLGQHPINVQHELEFARCMRSHGVTGFPDPDPQGQFQISGDIDANSPQFQRASNVCERAFGPFPIAESGSRSGGP